MAERKRRGLLFDEVLPEARRTAQSLLSLDPQEDVPASQQALEMALGFVPGVGQAMALRDIERARRAEDPAAAAMAAASFIPFGRLLGRGNAGPIMSELDVYHGTPHRFPATEANPLGEFDASKIGTGEGAQAYGHGIYLAEAPEVAESYKQMSPQMLPVSKYAPDEESAYYAARVVRQMGSPEKAIEKLAGTGKSQELVKAIKDGSYKRFYDKLPQASLYKADLPDEMIDRMLDWDKPLSEQPAIVNRMEFEQDGRKINAIVKDARGHQMLWRLGQHDSIDEALKTITGQKLNALLRQTSVPSESAKALREAGIPGIKYADAGSRGQGGSGTRNFVVFPGEEKKVKILERK